MAKLLDDDAAAVRSGSGADDQIAHASASDGGTADEKTANDKTGFVGKSGEIKCNARGVSLTSDSDGNANENKNKDGIVVTGADAAVLLLPLRDDGDPALTFRSIVLATGLSAFQAVMSQIYAFKPTSIAITGTFIVLIAHFLGKAWAALLPRGDKIEAKWKERGGGQERPPPAWIRMLRLINHGPWSLKEHAVCAITATSASNGALSVTVFAAQKLFYDLPLSSVTMVLSTISIGLLGYGVCGLMRPICVWDVESVYWQSLPTVKTLQGLHWQDVKTSKPLRVFWYSFGGMAVYEFFPAYIFPWLNSVSIPCLAAMKATGDKAAKLKNLFGGATSNEGLGLFSVSLDWQYVMSGSTAAPLKMQAHAATGYVICCITMLGIYYSNAWGALSQPFMSTRLYAANGTAYPTDKIFKGGVLDEKAFAVYGVPELTGSFALSLLATNAAVGALIAHSALFWGKDIVRAFQRAKEGKFNDRHHAYMAKHYEDVPSWWYAAVLVFSFILGLVVVIKENITLPVWAYVVSLVIGLFIAPLGTLLSARYGGPIGINSLSKMLAGLILPNRPVGNMYFAAWSENVYSNALRLSNDLKMGEYLKVPPRVMFITQIYGTVLGAFINYAVMISIINGNEDLLAKTDGNATWSGAGIQSYNTNAASWALAKYLYRAGAKYQLVPAGLGIGAAAVVVHRIITLFFPTINGFSLYEINLPQLFQYSGYLPYYASQTCIILTQILAGFFAQFYLRNYRPRIFKEYLYLVTGAWDGASLTVLFVLSFAVFGASGRYAPFPKWWGNNIDGNLDHCPVPQ